MCTNFLHISEIKLRYFFSLYLIHQTKIKVKIKMDNLVKGQQYYVKQFGTTIDKVVYYDEYRAKFLGIEQGINKFMSYNNINHYKTN